MTFQRGSERSGAPSNGAMGCSRRARRCSSQGSLCLRGRTLEAIEAICDAGGDLAVDVLDGLSSLVDKSLLKQEEGVGENRASDARDHPRVRP